MTTEVPKVYAAINAVQAELAKEGIAKDRNNPQQNYKFRGIDDVYNALSPLLAKHKLCILPRVVNRDIAEKQSKSGGTLFYTTLTMEFDFVSAEDGSKHIVCTVGEAMDSGDKSCNKAQSAAFKYACLQAFAIPTEGDNDTENHTHEVAAPAKAAPKKTASKEPEPETLAKQVAAVLKAAGCVTKEHSAVVIKFVTNDLADGNALRKDDDAARAFLQVAAEIQARHPGKKLLDVAKSADIAAQADKVF